MKHFEELCLILSFFTNGNLSPENQKCFTDYQVRFLQISGLGMGAKTA